MGYFCLIPIDFFFYLRQNVDVAKINKKTAPKEIKVSESNPNGLSVYEKMVPVLVFFSIILSFVIGVLWEKVSNLEKGGLGGSQQTATTTTGKPANVDISVVKDLWNKNIIKFGDANSKLLIVEVADPSCPYCHVAGGHDPELAEKIGTQFKYIAKGGAYVPPVPEIKKLVDSKKAAFAFLYFPGHGNGEMATKALYCAYDMGKFWQVHDLLMTDKGYAIQNGAGSDGVAAKVVVGNDKTKSQELADFLKGAADAKQMKDCLDSGKYDSRLAEEQNIAAGTLGITGTPGFLLNTTRFDGAYSWNDMKTTVDSATK